MLITRRALGALAVAGLLWAGTAAAEAPEDLLERGNTAYESGRFAEAAEAYRTILRYQIRDPVVEYNLGNAEFRLGNLGRAILHFERARRLDPTDADVQANLEFARSFCRDRVETVREPALVRWLGAAQNRLGPDGQAWIALGLVWLAAAIVAWCSARPGGWGPRHGWALAGVLLACAATTASWYATHRRLDGQRLAVVLDESASVLAGPGRNNAMLFTVHEGLTLEIRAEREEWLQVGLPNGLNGWIERGALERV